MKPWIQRILAVLFTVAMTGIAQTPMVRVTPIDRDPPRTNQTAPADSCSSDEACEQAARELCETRGYGGIQEGTVTRTLYSDGSSECVADCEDNGATAWITCNP